MGVETSLQNENGKYLQFRKQLPVSAATYAVRSSFFGTIGAYTEVIVLVKSLPLGLKFAYGTTFGSEYNGVEIYDIKGERLIYNYFKGTLHLTYKRFTCYMQGNESRKASGVIMGINYRLANNSSKNK